MTFQNREPIARRDDPDTSHLSASDITKSGQRDAQKQMVLDGVKQHPGLTSYELAATIGIDRYIAARRLPDLREDGFVINGKARQCAISKRMALTWWIAKGQGELF